MQTFPLEAYWTGDATYNYIIMTKQAYSASLIAHIVDNINETGFYIKVYIKIFQLSLLVSNII